MSNRDEDQLLTDGGRSDGVIERYCGECGETTEWERKRTVFGDGYRCECKRRFIELGDLNE